MPVRCFVAVEVAPEIRESLARFADRMRNQVTGAKWAATDTMHVTLAFLGEVPDGEVPALTRSLEGASSVPEFRLEVKGLGAFPRPSAARVLWAGIGAGSAELGRLAAEVREICRGRGSGEKDGGGYVPHLTVARFRAPLDLEPIEVFREERETERGACRVRDFTLFRSRLRPSGAVHEPVRRYALRSE